MDKNTQSAKALAGCLIIATWTAGILLISALAYRIAFGAVC